MRVGWKQSTRNISQLSRPKKGKTNMPKVKVPRKSTSLDMTPMVDVAFLLLTFFIMTTQFRPQEPVQVITPSSISDTEIPENDVIQVWVDKDGRAFFTMDGQPNRQALIQKMAEKYQLTLSPKQIQNFVTGSSIGVPMAQVPAYLNLPNVEAVKYKAPGVPVDTTNKANELGDWLNQARLTNPSARIVIKADGATKYPQIQGVIKTFTDRNVNRFNMITSMENNPMKQAEK